MQAVKGLTKPTDKLFVMLIKLICVTGVTYAKKDILQDRKRSGNLIVVRNGWQLSTYRYAY